MEWVRDEEEKRTCKTIFVVRKGSHFKKATVFDEWVLSVLGIVFFFDLKNDGSSLATNTTSTYWCMVW